MKCTRATARLLGCVLATARCSPIALTPVPQPISCHCPATTTLFRGELERTVNGTGVKHAVDVGVEHTPERLQISLFDGTTERALCSVTTDLHGLWQNGPVCPDPSEPGGTSTLTLVRGAFSEQGNAAELSFDAVLQGIGAPQAAKGHFVGKLVPSPSPGG